MNLLSTRNLYHKLGLKRQFLMQAIYVSAGNLRLHILLRSICKPFFIMVLRKRVG